MSQPSNTKQRLIATVMQFLADELANSDLSSDSKESIEVALQCLETAYNINPVDGTLPSKKSILSIFSDYLQNAKEEVAKKTISDDDKAKADSLKNEGNELMKNSNFQEALQAYTKAIEIDDTNPIYYCNRAAAHSKLGNHNQALEDCRIAIKQDPNYSKAYCRMGLAYVNLGDHQHARDCYKKAYELDPSESNQNNLRLAEQKLQEEQAQFNSGFNLGNILNNPQLMNMASQVISNPNMQQMFSQMMGNMMGGAPNEQSAQPDSTEQQQQPNMDAFLQMGQQFAEQMRQSNPELVEQLKNAFKKDDESKETDEN